MGTFEEVARPEFEPVWRVESERAEVRLVEVGFVEVALEVFVAEPQQHA